MVSLEGVDDQVLLRDLELEELEVVEQLAPLQVVSGHVELASAAEGVVARVVQRRVGGGGGVGGL